MYACVVHGSAGGRSSIMDIQRKLQNGQDFDYSGIHFMRVSKLAVSCSHVTAMTNLCIGREMRVTCVSCHDACVSVPESVEYRSRMAPLKPKPGCKRGTVYRTSTG